MLNSKASLLKDDSPGTSAWFASTIDPGVRGVLLVYESLLNASELKRVRRFRFERSKDEFILAHILARQAVADALGLTVSDIDFGYRDTGQPILTHPRDTDIFFSVSHTKDLVACAVNMKSPVGIDVERIERKSERWQLASRFFSPEEYLSISQAPTADRDRTFLNLWTLKEAYLKANGRGIQGLDEAIFTFDETGKYSLRNGHETRNCDEWTFLLSRPTNDHIAALAVRLGKMSLGGSKRGLFPSQSLPIAEWN
jgi:4'-phosphopantetheinyl transferase